jgi:hypothetical protein
VGWFVGCADRVDAAPPAVISALGDAPLRQRVAGWQTALGAASSPMPEVLRLAVREAAPSDLGVLLTGYSAYDRVDLPRAGVPLLRGFQGPRPWREALAEARLPLEPTLGEGLVRELYRAGVLADPGAPVHA